MSIVDDDPQDVLAVELIDAMSELAVTVRERDTRGIRRALNGVLGLADARAALVVAAAMIPADTPIDPWWLNPDDRHRDVRAGDVRRAQLAEALGLADDYVASEGAA